MADKLGLSSNCSRIGGETDSLSMTQRFVSERQLCRARTRKGRDVFRWYPRTPIEDDIVLFANSFGYVAPQYNRPRIEADGRFVHSLQLGGLLQSTLGKIG
jgi:hypothetical protein